MIKDGVLSSVDDSKLNASFGFTPEGAKERATVSGSPLKFGTYGNANNGVYEFPYKMATFEKGEIKLDGTFEFPKFNLGTILDGLSDENGILQNRPYIDYTLDKAYDLIGCQIWFDGKADIYPTELTVIFFNTSDTEIKRETFKNSEINRLINFTVNGAKRIRIQFNKLNKPYRFLRLAETSPGQIFLFDDSNIMSAEIQEGIEPFSDSLQIPKFEITFDNSAKKFDINNPKGLVSFLRTGMVIDANITIGGEEMLLCKWEFASWQDNQKDEVTTLGFAPTINKPSNYDLLTHAKRTFKEIAEHILGEVTIPSDIASKTLNGYIGEKVSKKAALNQLATAGSGYFEMKRDGSYEFKRFAFSESKRDIDYNTQFDRAEMEQTQYISGVNVPYTIWTSEVQNGKTIWNSEDIDCLTGTEDGVVEEVRSGFISDKALAEEVGRNALNYFKNRVHCDVEFKGDPSLLVGQTVKVENDYGLVDIGILRAKTTYREILETEIEGVGK